eukprot:CAMPEP_0198199448 /NCGR_PEP_ID=MMETSP1445-20131203/2756_1 /TAXON_ID=36898 /ORGANISM="Pyramimonas sp., Strain CCMP2087" /LENGTH=209 /DNA_ID=CAMNT_0043869301 /DNA_START=180 /DNA_END=805 /DNA_ORIENTATION=-
MEPRTRRNPCVRTGLLAAALLLLGSILFNADLIMFKTTSTPMPRKDNDLAIVRRPSDPTTSTSENDGDDSWEDPDQFSMDTYQLVYADEWPNEYPKKGGPTPACHAGTILHMEGGGILAAHFGGAKEGAVDVAIYLEMRLPGKDGIWSPPQMVAKLELDTPHWNPVLFCGSSSKDSQACDGTDIWLFYKLGERSEEWGCCGTWKTYYQR